MESDRDAERVIRSGLDEGEGPEWDDFRAADPRGELARRAASTATQGMKPVAADLQPKDFRMKNPTETRFISLPAARRLAHANLFIASLCSVSQTFQVPGRDHPLPGLKHLKGANLDVGATRLPREAYESQLIAWAQQRQVNTIILRLDDAQQGATDAKIDVVLTDVGVALFCDYRLHAQNTSDWWLVSDRPDEVSFRLTIDGLQPTFDVPWAVAGFQPERLETRRMVGATLAKELFAKFVWQ